MTKSESKEIKEKIEKLLEKGMTYHEIADEVGMKYNNLLTFFYRHNLKMDSLKLWKHKEAETLKKIKADIEKNELKQIEIARKYKVSRQYIHQIKKKMVGL